MTTPAPLKVTVVINGKFHSFDVAVELYKQGKLHKLISSMPKSVARKYGIDDDLYVGLPQFEFIKRFFRKILRREVPALWYSKQFTKSALKFIPADSDIIITSAGCSEEIFKSNKLKNIPKILDRSSTHTLSNIKLNKAAASYHGTEWFEHPKSFLERELEEYRLADKILVPSSYVKNTFLDNGIPTDKIIQIPYGVSKHKFVGLNKEDVIRKPAILFVGQLSARKGIGVLINSVELVRQTMPDVELWLVGAKLASTPTDILDKNWIKYWGVLRGQELYDKFKSAAAFCLTSFEEGMAYVLTEAAQCGLPIVATENTGAGDLVKESINGFVVEAGNPAVVAEKLLIILNDREKWEESVRKSHEEIFTWEHFTNKLIKELEIIKG